MKLSFFMILLISGCANTSSKETSSPVHTIPIGFIGPLTGDASSYGIATKNALELAVQDINTSGGIHGNPVKIIYEDGMCNGTGATAAAQKLINVDKVQYIIGGVCSGETLTAAPLAEQSHTILFSPSSGSPDISTAGDFIFRNFPSDSSSATKLASLALKKGYNTFAILSESTDYAQAFSNKFADTFQKSMGTISLQDSYPSTETDWRSELTKIKNSDANAILVVPQTPVKLLLILRQMHELGMKLPLFTSESIASETILQQNPSLAEGAYFAEPLFDDTRAQTKLFLKEYKTKYGNLGELPPIYIATAYDALFIAKEAMESVGEDTKKIKDYLYQIKNREGAAGVLTIDQNGDAEFEYVVKQIQNGKGQTVEDVP